jgi:hypothetical protein
MEGAAMKRCPRCGETKSPSEFYKNAARADGLQDWCKPCKVASNRAWQENSRDKKNEIHRKWREANPSSVRESDSRWKEHNPEKVRAWSVAKYALLGGALKRSPCEVCGGTENVHGHHDDYDKPLDVRWLCAKHHAQEHRFLRGVSNYLAIIEWKEGE